MHHNFFWNTLSFLVARDENIIPLLKQAYQGVLQFCDPEDTASISCLESEKFLTRKISTGKTGEDFIQALSAEGEHDLAVTILEIDDKADAFSNLVDEDFLEIANQSFYFTDIGYSGSVDVLALATHLESYLFSVGSLDLWSQNSIQFSTHPPAAHNARPLDIYSISCPENAQDLRRLNAIGENQSLKDLLPSCVVTEELSRWYEDESDENKPIIRRKLLLAQSRDFQGGEPLFKTLKNAEGLREIRFGARMGGAIRIIFSSIRGGKFALLTGWIKKSNSDGYSENISAANKLLEKLSS